MSETAANDRQLRAPRAYLAASPVLEAALPLVLRSMKHLSSDAGARLERSKPWLAERLDPIYVELLMKHFTAEDLEAAVAFMASASGRSYMKALPAFSAEWGDALQPILVQVMKNISGEGR